MYRSNPILLFFIAIIVLGGCGPSKPKHPGTVVIHVDEYQSGKGVTADLLTESQLKSTFANTHVDRAPWEATVSWRFVDRDWGKDIYSFDIRFQSYQDVQQQTRTGTYDGTKPVVVFDNGMMILSIEPD